MAINLVELMQGPDDDCAFDQPCKFGHRVDGYAVYCHNDAWDDSPRKCRRTWYTGGKTKDEDCPGFQPNPAFTGGFNPTPQQGPLCSQCRGHKIITPEKDRAETCPRCQGDGAEPVAIELSDYEKDALESGIVHSGKHNGRYERYVVYGKNGEDVLRLDELKLLCLHSMTTADNGTRVYLVSLTAKGEAVLHAIWDANKEP